MAAYGRNRDSIADIEKNLENIINKHERCIHVPGQEPTIPADALVGVFKELANIYGGQPIMSPNEIEQLQALLESNPGLAVTSGVLLRFIAERTRSSPESSPNEEDFELPDRGRSEDREDGMYNSNSYDRSSSNESSTTVYRRVSRPPSRGPPTPKTPSPFDTKNRQRSTPLQPPSSWSKPTPAHRRKSSDAGSRSDSEGHNTSPYAGRTPGRHRAPSNPTSPRSDYEQLRSPSPPRSRPASRQGYSRISPSNRSDDDDFNDMDINSLPMPRSADDDDEADENMVALGLISDRADSTASVESIVRLDALTRHNAELQRRLADSERQQMVALQQAETEIFDLNNKLDELRDELNNTKKEEKELRSKERTHSTQISLLENEMMKLNRTLEVSRANYTSLQKKYTEQCTTAEKYRDELRQREDEVRALRDERILQQLEVSKREKEIEALEIRISQLEQDLDVAQQTASELEEQKQENLLLKETIDRMRFDMDELRNNMSSGAISQPNSRANTLGKSLSAELGEQMKVAFGEMEEEVSEADSTSDVNDDDDTESEDVVQTIITRKKRKVGSRAKIETHHFEETKEYSDAGVQYDSAPFLKSASSQTAPRKAAFAQTAAPPPSHASTQTELDVPPVPVKVEMDIQTEDLELHVSRPASPESEVVASSSSSTILPPTPKPKEEPLVDAPPAYNQDWRIESEALQKWHKGITSSFQPEVPIAVSQDTLDEWAALKRETGISCDVIEKILAEAARTGQPRDVSKRKSRFLNIYNTYVYTPSWTHSALIAAGASALTMLLVGHVTQPNAIPGGPTYWDRPAWNSFNSMQSSGEGFTPDGTTAVWNFLGRVGGGAARLARGWPT